jgi:hypothetical protein
MRQHVQPIRRRKSTKLLEHQVDTVLLHFPSDFPSLNCLLLLFVLHTNYTFSISFNAREHEVSHEYDATITSRVEDTLFCQPCLQTCSFISGLWCNFGKHISVLLSLAGSPHGMHKAM